MILCAIIKIKVNQINKLYTHTHIYACVYIYNVDKISIILLNTYLIKYLFIYL